MVDMRHLVAGKSFKLGHCYRYYFVF